MTECERFKDLNFFDVGICKIKFDKEISLLDNPEFSGPNINPKLELFLFFKILLRSIKVICFLFISLLLALNEITTSNSLIAFSILSKTLAELIRSNAPTDVTFVF